MKKPDEFESLPRSTMNPKYKRIVLKLSGEALKNAATGEPLDPAILKNLALSIKEISSLGVQICLVVGGGNIFRTAVE